MPSYAELTPERLDELWSRNAYAVVPWGALEWHGSHLPLGMDGIVAEWFGQKLSDITDSVLLPTVWMPMTTLPHRHSQQIRTETFRMLLDDLLQGLYRSGARTICLITGHYAQGHQVEMSEASLRAMEDLEGLRVFSGSPLEPLNRPEQMDHAARYETSQMLAVRSDLVDLASLKSLLQPHDCAVLGEDPRSGSAIEGANLLKSGLLAWNHWIRTTNKENLEVHHRRVFDRYQTYMDEFLDGTWEEAILKWWQTKA